MAVRRTVIDLRYSMRSESLDAKSLVISAHARGDQCARTIVPVQTGRQNTVIVDETAAQVVEPAIHARFRLKK